jgi:acyl-coenzyme A thioesterase PaaI-like protein
MQSHNAGQSASARLKELIERLPFNELVGIQVLVAEPTRSKCKLQFRASLGNHVNSVHAAAQYALIEAASGAALMASFSEMLDDVIPLAAGAEVAYRAPALGDCTADATVDQEDIDRVKEELKSSKRSKVGVRVNLADSHGTISTEATIFWHIRVKPAPKS